MNSVKKRAVILVLCICLGLAGLGYCFPVRRISKIGPGVFGDYYTPGEIGMALWIGSAADRRAAGDVLRLADRAFADVGHTQAENEAAYGLLARYATASDNYPDGAYSRHSLSLWSAHLGRDQGWIWVCYTAEALRNDGTIAHGSWDIPSLWRVEKDNGDEWVVTQIREHP